MTKRIPRGMPLDPVFGGFSSASVLSDACLLGLFRYDLYGFGEGGRVHQRQGLGHGIVEIPAEDFPQSFLAYLLRPTHEVTQFFVQREACLVQYALVEGCIPITEGQQILVKDRIQAPMQAAFNIPMTTYAMSRIIDVLEARKIVASLGRLLAGDIVNHHLAHAYESKRLLPLRKQSFLLAWGQGIEIKGPLLELVVADFAGHMVAPVDILELPKIFFGED